MFTADVPILCLPGPMAWVDWLDVTSYIDTQDGIAFICLLITVLKGCVAPREGKLGIAGGMDLDKERVCACVHAFVCVCVSRVDVFPSHWCVFTGHGVVFQEQKGPDEIRAGFDLDKSSSLHEACVPSAVSPHSSEANVASVPMYVKSR